MLRLKALNEDPNSDLLFDPNVNYATLDAFARTRDFDSGEALLRSYGNHAMAEIMGKIGKAPQSVEALLQSSEAKNADPATLSRIKECDQLLRNLYRKTLIGELSTEENLS